MFCEIEIRVRQKEGQISVGNSRNIKGSSRNINGSRKINATSYMINSLHHNDLMLPLTFIIVSEGLYIHSILSGWLRNQNILVTENYF